MAQQTKLLKQLIWVNKIEYFILKIITDLFTVPLILFQRFFSIDKITSVNVWVKLCIYYFRLDFYQETNKLSNSDDDPDFFHGDFAQTASSAQDRPQSSLTTQVPDANQACGVVTMAPRPLISKGHDTRPGILNYIFHTIY